MPSIHTLARLRCTSAVTKGDHDSTPLIESSPQDADPHPSVTVSKTRVSHLGKLRPTAKKRKREGDVGNRFLLSVPLPTLRVSGGESSFEQIALANNTP
eukprot:9059197-Pyramimonas_sp.AAC.1